MVDFEYWKKQTNRVLFPQVDTWPPEQKRFAGKLLIIGGNKGAFFAEANVMQAAQKMGVGEVRLILPKSLRGMVPSLPEISFAEATPSGAFAKTALAEILTMASWADAVILAGDFSKNAEISILLSQFMQDCRKPVYMMRDAIDALTEDADTWATREEPVGIFATVPQLQKLLKTMYYPKMITLSMPTNQLVETLHKFTLSFPVTVATYHNEQIIFAQDGEVVTMALAQTRWSPITLWGGELLVRAAILKLWNPGVAELACFSTAVMGEE